MRVSREEELESSLEWLNKNNDAVFNSAPIATAFTDLTGSIVKTSQTLEDWVSLSKTELLGLKFRDLLTIGGKIYFETNISPLIKMQGYVNEVALELKTKSGSPVPILMTADEIRNDQNKPIFIRYMLFHVQDRRKYEKDLLGEHRRLTQSATDLLQNNAWFSATIKSIGDAVIAVNIDQTISLLNGVAENLTGWTQDEALGKHVSEIFNIVSSETRAPAFNPVERVIQTGQTLALEKNTILISRSKHEYQIEDSAAPIKNSAGEVVGAVLVFRDVTEQKMIEAAEKVSRLELQEAVDNLELEKKTRERFVLALTHDLRTPLTSIKMSAQLLNRMSDRPDMIKTIAKRLIAGVDRGDRLIRDLLDANSIKAGEGIPLQISECDLVETVRAVETELSGIHGARFKVICKQWFRIIHFHPDSRCQVPV